METGNIRHFNLGRGSMPYLFLYENVFVVLVSLVIAGLLLVRWYVVQDRKK
jgi:hypothetical protein